MGNRDGSCDEMEFGSREVIKTLFEFCATNAQKGSLYQLYDFINANIVKVLAVLTSTGKTRVVLVEDDFVEKVKKFEKTLPHSLLF